MALARFNDYSREDVHQIFSPHTDFTPGAGTWGLHGIVSIPDRPDDFIFFVTFGQKQGDHEFDEGITSEGVLSWQSQPRQSFNSAQIQQFINHDELTNSIYLFLRTSGGKDYTYLGKLKYLNHDAERENPVYFQWQIIDCEIPPEVTSRIGLDLVGPGTEEEVEQVQSGPAGLVEVQPPEPHKGKGTDTKTFRGRKGADYSGQDARNRKLGLAGELLVLKHEKEVLSSNGRLDLAGKVIHVSEEEGDGAGYDILSFTLEGEAKFIEVKTTRGGQHTAFYMSANEVAFNKAHVENYYLYRVFQCKPKEESGKFYALKGDMELFYNLTPIQYRLKIMGQ